MESFAHFVLFLLFHKEIILIKWFLVSECVCVICVLASVVSGGGPGILSTTDLSSVLVQNLCSPYRLLNDATGIWVISPPPGV